ncbi:TPA: polysaccharide biosynthesis tyrosine autokinase [Providencia stuartii]|uniref:Polysaccharide biosynthesis tyrosine autokinase n=2 Tax=Providencia stuartii TaxID=588 RepID=A0AAJ1JGL4_PROST|nr:MULTISPECIES: polysaccharide biosynthesis tyrosine autokinase [Providencia]EMA3640815.1 polysaccharide biosynthesis tyrosine autokinase [Providencia stuartii]MBW3100764.1 polysaccharide biosynthesis tyrosine autokinase [Providencia stuartii]MCB5216358.1 polysaccharide biosynthesis tyrosine autokinase [Providencia stuartii]MCL8325501.1 polysaccharide biosynthesis tyrosine autokinase [Providencia thailandensis]MDE8751789.1 polysaccharide biosynthesis tyrosine autokinase [Providencia thailande
MNTTKTSSAASDEIDLLALFKILKSSYLKIGFFTLFFIVIGAAYSFLATPIYQANATLQYDKMSQVSLLDQMSDVMPFANSNSQVDSEIEVIKSRMVLGKTVADLNLDTQVAPAGFFDRLWGDKASVAISLYSLPEHLIGEPAIVTYLGENRYTLHIDNQTVEGKVGELLKQDEISLLVSSINAEVGQEFTLSKNARYSTIENLRKTLAIAEVGKGTGIISMEIKGSDKAENVQILNSIIQNYVDQNTERKKEVTNNTLLFLDEYLPKIKAKLDNYENQLNAFRKKNESIDLSLEAKSALDSALQVEEKLNELTFKEVEIQQLYTRNHPAYQSLLDKRQQLLREKEKISKNIQKLPNTQQQIVRLTRDVESEQAIYNQLVAKQQELSVLNSGITADVRIIDSAESQPNAVAPKKSLILVLATILGFIVGCAYVIAREFFNNKIKGTEDIDALGVNVYATIPFSNYEKKLIAAGNQRPLALENPADTAVEAIRSLRTSVYFSVMNQGNNLVMISSASPGVGKSFVTSNMAVVLANAGKKVLLIDTDLRKGRIHKAFGLSNKAGLSEYLAQQDITQPVIHRGVIENLDVICRGKNVTHSSELLMGERFKHLLDTVKGQYDIVVIDTAPILAITDSAIIGKYVGTSLLIAYYGVNTVKDIELSLKRFKQNDIEITGVILNGIDAKSDDYNYVYEY